MASLRPLPTAGLLALMLLPGTALPAAEDDRPDPAAADGQDGEVARLIASGSAAERRFNADKAANRSAIIDAALAFARAQRLLGRTATDPRRVDVQTHLYRCRKQMDVETLAVFARRLGELDRAAAPRAQPTAGAVKPANATVPPVAVQAPPPPAPTAIDAATAHDELVARTRGRALALAAAGRPPRLTLDSTRQEAILVGGDARAAGLRIGDLGMDLPWRLLTDADWCAIALDLTRSGEPADHALAACWLAGQRRSAEAEAQLIAAGPAATAAIAALLPALPRVAGR